MTPEKEHEHEIEPNGNSVLPSDVTEQADALVGSIGHTVDSATEAVQDTLRRAKRSTRIAMRNVSEGIQSSTDFLARKGIVGAVEDVEVLIRRHPFEALLIGLSMGYLLSQFRKR